MELTLPPTTCLSGRLQVPGDKSITHRALLLSALADGQTRIKKPLLAADPRSTAELLRRLGVEIVLDGDEFLVNGVGMAGLKEPLNILDCGNAGTLMRLVSGLLAGQAFFSVLGGDNSLSARPMERVTTPLLQMGARIDGREQGRFAPLAIRGGRLLGIHYELPVASAQVKSALLLAGMFAEGETEVIEASPTRDHTERMFHHFGLPLERHRGRVITRRADPFPARDLTVPGDFSSAAFFIVAALISPEADLTVEGVGLNPSRTGLLTALTQMGALLEWQVTKGQDGEPLGWVRARSSELHGIDLDPKLVPLMVDEIPVLAAAAAWAGGPSRLNGLGELRLKESDRVHAIAENLRNLGASVQEGDDWLAIQGGGLRPGVVEPAGDHRIAMAFAVAGLSVGVLVHEAHWADISYPSFFNDLKGLVCRS